MHFNLNMKNICNSHLFVRAYNITFSIKKNIYKIL